MHITFLTLFPSVIESYFQESIMKRARKNELVVVDTINFRDFTHDAHKTVDQPPYGGGVGMVLMVEPIAKALTFLKEKYPDTKKHVILLSAKGEAFTQQMASHLSTYDHLVFICGHYEGVDERVREYLVDQEISIGPYVLTGGELPALSIADSVVRLLPGVLGKDESSKDESHATEGVLEYPQYTRPQDYNGWKVPEVLLSGDHAEISKWREQARATSAPTISNPTSRNAGERPGTKD